MSNMYYCVIRFSLIYIIASIIYHIPFPDCKIHLCDFHREMAWNKWLSKTEHGLSSRKEEILVYLRSIATSANKHMLDMNIKTFKESEIWKQSTRLQKYFTEYWQTHIQVYVICTNVYCIVCYGHACRNHMPCIHTGKHIS
jgi:hypothetical protein